MKAAEFECKYSSMINQIAQQIEEFEQQGNLDEDIEIDISSDLLTIEVKEGIYVINKQSSIQEIWLSSPKSGPYHFKYGKRMDLVNLLSKELNLKLEIDDK